MAAKPTTARNWHRPAQLSTRTKARKQALDVLFEADLLGKDPQQALDDWRSRDDITLRDYAIELVQGVIDECDQIDRRIEAALGNGWTLDRMPRVDRTLARIAVYEFSHDIDVRVAISQALVLAGELSTDDSPAFLNGVLAQVAQSDPLELEQVEQADQWERQADPAHPDDSDRQTDEESRADESRA